MTKGAGFSADAFCSKCADNCLSFAIDAGLELVILYEHIYEIYGDIQGATNAFKIKAYEQGKQSWGARGCQLKPTWMGGVNGESGCW